MAMNSLQDRDTSSLQYPTRTIVRAERAMRCSPFNWQLFAAMREQSVTLGAIAGVAGIESQYVRQAQSELAAENALVWLIDVGVLRREVDGQGITDGFRLTPLGRQLVEKWHKLGGVWPAPSWQDRLYNFLSRWLRMPV